MRAKFRVINAYRAARVWVLVAKGRLACSQFKYSNWEKFDCRGQDAARGTYRGECREWRSKHNGKRCPLYRGTEVIFKKPLSDI